MNDCANILLAAGASPTMAHHPLEVEEITAGTKALVCNFGAIADYEAMEKAGRVAGELGHAIVIDPVGVSGSLSLRGQGNLSGNSAPYVCGRRCRKSSFLWCGSRIELCSLPVYVPVI